MNYSRIVRDGSARDEALKRRNGAVSEVLRMGPTPKRQTEQPAEQNADEKLSEQSASAAIAGYE
jgi:hypothetical protein